MPTSTPYLAEVARVNSIVTHVIDDLRGTIDEVEDVEPRKTFCIGVLSAPRLDEGNGSTRQRRYNFESLGFSARVAAAGSRISGTASASVTVWYRVLPSFDEQRAFAGNVKNDGTYQLQARYARHIVPLGDLPFSVDLDGSGAKIIGNTQAANDRITHAFAEARKGIAKGPNAHRLYPGSARFTLKGTDLATAQTFAAAVSGSLDLPDWRAALDVSVVQTADGPRLTLTLANRTPNAKQHQAELFDAGLSVELEDGCFEEREFHADRNESRYATRSWGKGIGCVLEVDDDRKHATACTVPLYQQKRSQHRELVTATSPDALSGPDVEKSIGALIDHLVAYRSAWQQLAEQLPPGEKRETAFADLVAFDEEIAMVRRGLEALRTDPRLKRAFQLMNRAAALTGTEGQPFVAWRPFQIAFIVGMMPSLLARERPESPWLDDLHRVDVLWFPTGGGKSEATFGVILAALFYDRLRGKEYGVTAWMRYPLRMLSIQQLQRLVEFIVAGEMVRNTEKLVGDPFTLGYYVGEQNTPNILTSKRNVHPITRYKQRAQRDGTSFMRVLQACPYRDCSDRTKIDVEIDDAIDVVRIIHKCKACGRVAPIYISDSEIYRYIPSVLVGTVDRLARAGQAHEFVHLYGQVDSRCPQHGYARHKTCVESGCSLGKRVYTSVSPCYDPVPALLIQDELHLLKESLGTYDSHYEGFLDSFARAVGKGLVPKRIAATATIEGFDRHVRELYGYGREARRFPARGPGENESAYVSPYDDDRLSRVYVGVFPNGLTSDQVAARIAEKVHRLAVDHEKADNDGGIGACYDVSLLYANTKDSLGNMGAELKPKLPKLLSLSGERSLDEVREAIDILSADAGRPLAERSPAVISTNIISHGFDMARLNVMAFSAFPGKAADYIQSSSRVGRTHVGLVFLVCDPTREVDRSTFAHFHEYHERFYALVQPVPIIRYSQSAVQRTFTGIFAASLIATLNSVKNGDLGEGRKAAASLVAGIPTEDEIGEAVEAAYDIDRLDPELREKYRDLIRRLTHVAHSQVINNGDDWGTSQRLRPKPMASLREVQEAIGFDVTPRRHREVQQLRGRRS